MMKKLIFKKFGVHAGSYDFNINFIVTKDIPKAIIFVNYKLELPCDDYLAVNKSDFELALGKHFGRLGYCPIVWIPEFPQTPEQHGTLAHEIFHAVCSVMRWANVPLGRDSEEAYCHLIKHITRKVYEHFV
jgi:hypothetical protein